MAVIFKNGGYTNVNESKIDIGAYRYPPSYAMPSILLLNLMSFLRYCDIRIEDHQRPRKPENSKNGLFKSLVPNSIYPHRTIMSLDETVIKVK